MTDRKLMLQKLTSHRADLLDYAVRLTGDPHNGEDIVQEAYLRMATRAPDRVVKPFHYMKRIVRNLAMDAGRRIGRDSRHFTGAEDVGTLVDERPDTETIISDREEIELVRNAIAALPDRTRRALELYRMEQRTLQQVADELGVSLSTAHALVRKGLVACSNALGGHQ